MYCQHHRSGLSTTSSYDVVISGYHCFNFQPACLVVPFSKANNKIKWSEPLTHHVILSEAPLFLPPWKLHWRFQKTWPGQSFLCGLVTKQQAWGCLTGPEAAWLFTAERCLSAPPRQGSAAPAPRPSAPGQLEPEAGSYSLAPGCLVRRPGQPQLNHGSAVAFLQKGLSKRKEKAILTSNLPPHPPVECSFWWFSHVK